MTEQEYYEGMAQRLIKALVKNPEAGEVLEMDANFALKTMTGLIGWILASQVERPDEVAGLITAYAVDLNTAVFEAKRRQESGELEIPEIASSFSNP